MAAPACHKSLLAIINQYGGKMKETYGVPVEEIQEAIKFGVRKINIDTDIRLAMTGAVRKFHGREPRQVRCPRMAQARPRSRQSRSASNATWNSAAKARAAKSKA
jgi:fructose/tagatose bisphosphate aldolase